MNCYPRYIHVIIGVVAVECTRYTHSAFICAYMVYGLVVVPCFYLCNEDLEEEWAVELHFSDQINNRTRTYHQHLCLVRESKI